MLGRAMNVLSREMTKNPAALAHVDTRNMAGLVQSLGVLVEQEPRNAEDLESSGI